VFKEGTNYSKIDEVVFTHTLQVHSLWKCFHSIQKWRCFICLQLWTK